MAQSDWIPSREQDFADLVARWISFIQLDANIAAYKWDKDECLALMGKLKAFLAAREAYAADNSSVNLLAKNAAKREAERAMRDFANTYVRFNKYMDAAARGVLGVRAEKPEAFRLGVCGMTANSTHSLVEFLPLQKLLSYPATPDSQMPRRPFIPGPQASPVRWWKIPKTTTNTNLSP